MGTSSAVARELERLAAELGDWAASLLQWERRLAQCGFHPAATASMAVAFLRLALDRQHGWVGDRAHGFRRADAAERLSAMNERVHRVLLDSAKREHGARATLQRGLAEKNERVYLRGDTRNDGQLVEVLGDLVNAQHIIVLVPGMTNELANFETQIRPRAVALLAEAKRQAPGTRVAVIAWLGYDSPDLSFTGLLQARESGRARIGAESLGADLETIPRLTIRRI